MSAHPTVGGIVLADPAFWRRPGREEAFPRLRRERPVGWQEVPVPKRGTQSRGFWALCRHAEVERVSRDWETFSSAEGTSIEDEPVAQARALGGMLNMDSPDHVRLRRIVNRAFAPAAIARTEEAIASCAASVVDGVAERGECDFARDIAQPFPVAVTCDLLGAPASDRPRLQGLTTTALAADVPEVGGPEAGLAAFLELNEYGERLAREKRARPGEDLMTHIVRTEVDGERLGDEEAGVFFQLLVTAGIETTGTATAQGILALTEFPDEHRRWRRDPGRLAAAVEEIIRYTSPVIHFRRTATRDVELAGQAIAPGDKVVMWYNSANRDERVFEEPDRLILDRHPNPHVGFGGGGRHFCLGANLARAEMRAVFLELFRRLPDLEPNAPPVLLPSRFINGVQSLPCRFTPSRAEGRR